MKPSEIKFQMRCLISTIHSMVRMLSDFRYEVDCNEEEIKAIKALSNATSKCFDELYKEVKK